MPPDKPLAEVIFITGGQRSGKSRYAQERALNLTDSPDYLATARIWDEEFQSRVNRHKEDRDSRWTTLEEEKYLSRIELPAGSVVVLDCITLWMTNWFSDEGYDGGKALEKAKTEWDRLIRKDLTLITVSNELGMGLHGNTPELRAYQDMQGFINQYIAATAREVWFMVSGIPMKAKG